MLVCHTNEFVQSQFSDGVLIALTEVVGWWMAETATIASHIGPGLKSQPGFFFFFANFCTNSYKRIHTIVLPRLYENEHQTCEQRSQSQIKSNDFSGEARMRQALSGSVMIN